jgi:oxalate decarboxylase
MPEDRPSSSATTRRAFLSHTGSALAAAAAIPVLNSAHAAAQQSIPAAGGPRPANHDSPNEQQPGPNNTVNDQLNPDSVWPPKTDNGTVEPFKYSFDLAHKEIDSGGWTRQVTVRELPVSKTMAGVEMHLTAGGIRELHWHVSAEWAFMISGSARITAVDANARSFVNDVQAGDLWLFPGGVPHSIQGLGPDGCKFLLVFNQGDFDEFDTFLLSDWFNHTPKDVLAKNFGVPETTFDMIPKEKLYIFQSEVPRPLTDEQKQAAAGTGAIDDQFIFHPAQMQPTKTTPGGDVKIIDRKNFPVTNIAAAMVRLKPGGLRELHWHPLADEWQYYLSGKGRMGIFEAGGKARTMDFQAGDVGYIQVSRPHWIENTGSEDLVFLELFPNSEYQDISAGEWLAHTPTRLVNEHLQVGEEFLNSIPKTKSVITPI